MQVHTATFFKTQRQCPKKQNLFVAKRKLGRLVVGNNEMQTYIYVYDPTNFEYTSYDAQTRTLYSTV